MALPLPRVIPDVGPGGGLVTAMKGINALQASNLQNQINRVKAEYAPYTEYANAASKTAYANLLPYQIQAQLMSNPMMWMAIKDNPDAVNAIVKNFKESIPTSNNIFGQIQIPKPHPMNQGGLASRFFNYLNRDKAQAESNNALTQPVPMANQQNMPSEFGAVNQASPQEVQQIADRAVSGLDNKSILSPASSSSMGGVIAKQTAPYVSQPYEEGKTITIDGKNYSVPAGATVANTQKAYIGIKNALPILNRISEGAEEFLGPGSKAKQAAAKINGLVKQYGSIDLLPKSMLNKYGITDEYLGRYNDWKAQINSSIEPLISAFDLPKDTETTKMLQGIMNPGQGESGTAYRNRVLNDISRLTGERLPFYQQILKNAIPLESEYNQPIQKKTAQAKTIDLSKFSGPDEFRAWFKKQDKATQAAVLKQLGSK